MNLITQLLIIVFTFSLLGCATLPRAVEPSQQNPKTADLTLYAISHGWHTGIILDASALNTQIPELQKRFPQAQYYEIGWGDTGFYQSEAITTRLTLNAVFWPTQTVIHIVGFNHQPAVQFPYSHIIPISIDQDDLPSLLQFLDNSFDKTASGQIISLASGRYGNSQFYQGVGKYYLFNTCNKWTAKAFYSSGIPINSTLKLTASSVMNKLEKHPTPQPSNPRTLEP